MRTLAELKKSDSNAYSVFGDWVPGLLQRIERTNWRGAKPIGPLGNADTMHCLISLRNSIFKLCRHLLFISNAFFLGAYIKLKDIMWAPVVERCLGVGLHNFICSNDEDAKQLNRVLNETVPRGRQKPSIITTAMNGQVFAHYYYCSYQLFYRLRFSPPLAP